MTEAKTAQQAQELIEKAGEQNKDAVRYIEEIAVGKAIRQGDLYVRRIAKVPAETRPTKERQLAPGNTRGSRHIVEGDVDVLLVSVQDPLQGPVLVAKSRIRITHPEHAHFSLPAGTYSVTYQRDFDREEIARVMD